MAESDHRPPSASIARIADTAALRVVEYRCCAGPRDRVVGERHSRACIAWVRRGRFSYHRDGKVRTLGPGSLLLGNAGDEYFCSHDQAGGDECVAFEYSPTVLDDISATIGIGAKRDGRFFDDVASPVIPAIDALLAAPVTGGQLEVEERGYRLAHAAIRQLAFMRNSKGGAKKRQLKLSDHEIANAAAIHIEQQAATGDELGLPQIAKTVALSPFHFLRTFKASTGMTPHQYLLRYRVRRAVELLRDTKLPVTDVAFAAGFGDLSNFIRTFRTFMGCSPRTFRQGTAKVA